MSTRGGIKSREILHPACHWLSFRVRAISAGGATPARAKQRSVLRSTKSGAFPLGWLPFAAGYSKNNLCFGSFEANSASRDIKYVTNRPICIATYTTATDVLINGFCSARNEAVKQRTLHIYILGTSNIRRQAHHSFNKANSFLKAFGYSLNWRSLSMVSAQFHYLFTLQQGDAGARVRRRQLLVSSTSSIVHV